MEHKFQSTKQGSPQGSCNSPIHANICLDKLDRFMEDIIKRDTIGKYHKQNPKYAQLRYQLNKSISIHHVKEIKRIRRELKNTHHTCEERKNTFSWLSYQQEVSLTLIFLLIIRN